MIALPRGRIMPGRVVAEGGVGLALRQHQRGWSAAACSGAVSTTSRDTAASLAGGETACRAPAAAWLLRRRRLRSHDFRIVQAIASNAVTTP